MFFSPSEEDGAEAVVEIEAKAEAEADVEVEADPDTEERQKPTTAHLWVSRSNHSH